jgi:hypothetical protein
MTNETELRLQIPTHLTLSNLQKKILLHVCTTNDASYKTLIEDIGKDRITILQSLESLIKYRYIEKQRLIPEREKSKLIFIPSYKGKAYALYHLNVELVQIVKTNGDDEVNNYIEFVKEVFHPSQHKLMIEPLFNVLERGQLDKKNSDKEKSLIKESFRKGLSELIQQKNYNAHVLFKNGTSREWLKKLYHTEGLKEFRELFIRARDNLTATIKLFPD